jgi:hypothetical protein
LGVQEGLTVREHSHGVGVLNHDLVRKSRAMARGLQTTVSPCREFSAIYLVITVREVGCENGRMVNSCRKALAPHIKTIYIRSRSTISNEDQRPLNNRPNGNNWRWSLPRGVRVNPAPTEGHVLVHYPGKGRSELASRERSKSLTRGGFRSWPSTTGGGR